MSHCHLIAYRANDGTSGVAEILTDRSRPSWAECAEQIPGYVTGRDLGPAPLFTLRYATACGPSERSLTFAGIQRVGGLVMRLADRDEAWGIEVLADGGDVTFNFPVFCA
ncbi:MAG: hypothetical protein ACRDP6_14600 [Actinoallomurus sp.]